MATGAMMLTCATKTLAVQNALFSIKHKFKENGWGLLEINLKRDISKLTVKVTYFPYSHLCINDRERHSKNLFNHIIKTLQTLTSGEIYGDRGKLTMLLEIDLERNFLVIDNSSVPTMFECKAHAGAPGQFKNKVKTMLEAVVGQDQYATCFLPINESDEDIKKTIISKLRYSRPTYISTENIVVHHHFNSPMNKMNLYTHGSKVLAIHNPETGLVKVF